MKKILSLILLFNSANSYFWQNDSKNIEYFSKEELDSLVDELIEERLPNVLSDIFSFSEKQYFKDKHNKIIGFRFILSLICKKKLQTYIKDFVKCKANYSSCSTKEEKKYQVDYYIEFYVTCYKYKILSNFYNRKKNK